MEAFEELFAEEEPQPKSRHVFIVRIWSEPNEEAVNRPSWRGSIQTVGSDQWLYFHELGAIQRFIEETLQLKTGGRMLAWWQSLLQKLHLYE